MTQTTDLEQRLRAVESGGLPSMKKGVTTCWYRNPDGPEAADEIARLREALEVASSALSNAAENGFYVGEGVFEKINAALKESRHE